MDENEDINQNIPSSILSFHDLNQFMAHDQKWDLLGWLHHYLNINGDLSIEIFAK